MKAAIGFRSGFLIPLLALGILAGCSATSTKSAAAIESAKSAELTTNLNMSLSKAGLKDISARHNSVDGTVTLSGQAQSDEDKSKAELIAKSMMAGHGVSNQISVIPMGHGHMDSHGRGAMGGHGRERQPEPPR